VPSSRPDTHQVDRLIAELDDDQFAVREKAAAELLKLSEPARPALKKALEETSSAEQSQRIKDVLAKLKGPVVAADDTGALRAVEVLERIGTREAREVLEILAKGAADAPLTLEVQASLRRLHTPPAARP